MLKFAIQSLGCKVNSYESMKMVEDLEKLGLKQVDFTEKADIYLVNTCTVTNIADRKSRQLLHRAKKNNEDAIIVACGCYVETGKDRLLVDDSIDVMIGNKEKDQIAYIVKEELEKRNIFLEEATGNTTSTVDEKCSRIFLKVQDGCDRFCSYCLIPYARGRIESRPLDEVIEEVKHYTDLGYQEVVLTGIHLSSYGKNIEGLDLLKLINEISKVEKVKRIRLGSLEQSIITEEFMKSVSENEKFCPHFHLSLQSGSDSVLKRMNRKYSAEEFKEKCDLIRKYYKHPALTTDIIVGFPGETEEEFEETKKFVDEIKFYETHVFIYSKRDGTRAAKMENQVPDNIKKERSKILIDKNEINREKYLQYFIENDLEIDVLVEEKVEINGEFYFKGHSREYVPVYIKNNNNDLTNHIFRDKIRGRFMDGLLIEK